MKTGIVYILAGLALLLLGFWIVSKNKTSTVKDNSEEQEEETELKGEKPVMVPVMQVPNDPGKEVASSEQLSE